MESARITNTSDPDIRNVDVQKIRGDKSYTIRELITELLKTEDLDAAVTVQFRNCDPIIVTNVNFEEGQVVLEAEV